MSVSWNFKSIEGVQQKNASKALLTLHIRKLSDLGIQLITCQLPPLSVGTNIILLRRVVCSVYTSELTKGRLIMKRKRKEKLRKKFGKCSVGLLAQIYTPPALGSPTPHPKGIRIHKPQPQRISSKDNNL